MRELARRELARRSFPEYLAYAQRRGWKRTRLSEFLAARVQQFLETETGHAYDVLVIETPPQHGKSMTVTKSVPSWYLGKHPERQVIMASYNETFAERFLRRNKEKIRRYGRNLFGIGIGNVDPGDGDGAGQRRGADYLGAACCPESQATRRTSS